jgi:hypothetical protein
VNYGAGLRLVDFIDAANREQSRLAINQWVSDQTEAKIPSFQAGGVDRDARLLANAIYFAGCGDAVLPQLGGRVHAQNGEAIPLTLMGQHRRHMPGSADYQAIALYQGDRVEMLVLVPRRRTDAETGLTASGWPRSSRLAPADVALCRALRSGALICRDAERSCRMRLAGPWLTWGMTGQLHISPWCIRRRWRWMRSTCRGGHGHHDGDRVNAVVRPPAAVLSLGSADEHDPVPGARGRSALRAGGLTIQFASP